MIRPAMVGEFKRCRGRLVLGYIEIDWRSLGPGPPVLIHLPRWASVPATAFQVCDRETLGYDPKEERVRAKNRIVRRGDSQRIQWPGAGERPLLYWGGVGSLRIETRYGDDSCYPTH